MDYSRIVEAVKEAGKIALDESLTQEISVKGQSDFVTAVDLKINNYLKERLQNIDSSINFFSEEQEGKLIDPCWILDPIDGTTNLIYGFNLSSVSLGLYQDGQVIFEKHPRMYIRGKWLHIHDKEKLRIGVVDIKQEYDHFEARGQNFSYLGVPAEDDHVTVWTYKMAIVKDDKSNCDYLGCYSADKRVNETQDGMHMLTVGRVDSKTGYPIYMRGGFADTFKVNSKEDKNPPVVNNHCGNLYLYKMSKKLEEYLYDAGSGEALEKKVAGLCKHPDFQDEPFVQEYRECMNKYNLWNLSDSSKN